jgi:hypothetical protein
MFWRCLVFSRFICLTAQGFENESLPKLITLANQTETLTKQYPLVADCWALQRTFATLSIGLTKKTILKQRLSLKPT